MAVEDTKCGNDARETRFDYSEAVSELERIVSEVENPGTGLAEIDRYIMRADVLIASCRKYLRSAREKTDSIETF